MSATTLLHDFARAMYEETLCVPERIDVPFPFFDRLVTESRLPIGSWELHVETGHGIVRVVCSTPPPASGGQAAP